MTFDELKNKAASLPLSPGVYIMRDADHKVIYVGKAKKLRNRVSQYFVDTVSHSPKTRIMVSKIHHFDVIIASSEFEALVLECAQIKRYMPKYNILLKDDKGFPYIRLDMKVPYPILELVSKPADDGAVYYGPFGSRGVTLNLIEAIQRTFSLPTCSKQFPRDFGKGRPCLNFHMKQCVGWCQKDSPEKEYRDAIEQARQVLLGNYKQVSETVRKQMHEAAENWNFELAASLRDRINAIEALSKKQFVTAGNTTEIDAIGYGETESKACFAVLHFSRGELVDKEYEILSKDDPQTTVSSLLKQYYLSRGFAPKTILLPFAVADSQLFAELLQQQYEKKTTIKVPQRGDNVRLMELACKNAQEEAERITNKEERSRATLTMLEKMLSIQSAKRIESYDISNISGTDNVASMVVFIDGKAHKSDYKRFKVDLNGQQDDYGSMRQVLIRRFSDYVSGKKGFENRPDLLLIDGGSSHAQVAENVLSVYDLAIPVFGMVKDDRHRTRALITADGREIRIDNQQAIFSFIGSIQEETHRFAISYHRKLRSKRMRYSELDQIEGIGPKRKQELLKHFSSISAIKMASLQELEHYLPQNAAAAVYAYFHQSEG